MGYENLIEKKISSQDVYDGVLLHVKKDMVKLPDGKDAVRELIRHQGAVAVVALTEDGCVIMESQYRYPMDEVIREIPAGKLDGKSEDHLEAAKRELLEETGIKAADWREIGIFYPTPAYSDEKIYLYLARDLEYGSQRLDEDEFLDVERIPLEQVKKMIMDGEIKDGKTQAAILKACAILES